LDYFSEREILINYSNIVIIIVRLSTYPGSLLATCSTSSTGGVKNIRDILKL
jgi:hypothetical protein